MEREMETDEGWGLSQSRAPRRRRVVDVKLSGRHTSAKM